MKHLAWATYYLVLRLLGWPALLGFYMINNITRNKRARALMVAPDGQILLVINALGDRRWTLPGGGMKRGETPAQAAAREVSEELGVEYDALRFEPLGEVRVGSYRAPLLLLQLHAEEIPQLHSNKWEIRAYRWCTQTDIPLPHQPLVRQALELLSRRSEIGTIS